MSIFFAGCYTQMICPGFGGSGKGIYTVELDDVTGETKLLDTEKVTNPGYITLSSDKQFLYAVTEVAVDEFPKVKSFKVKEDFSLELLNEQAIEGGYPCHIHFFNNTVFIACYGTGNVLVFPIDTEGRILESSQNVQHYGASINKERQEAAHPHQITFCATGKNVCIPDLGLDAIKLYPLEDGKLQTTKSSKIEVPKGGGPRHMLFNKKGDLGYLVNELTGDISILKEDNGGFSFVKSVSSLPETFKEQPSASAIRIHPNERFLYVANRTLDAISIFEIEGEDLNLLGFQYTDGKTLREFNITPDGKWLLACLQDSDELISYQVSNDGTLIEVYRNTTIISPVCITFY